MAQTGFTPISLYYTTTASAAPTAGNLVAGELALNTADGKLFYKDSGGVVQTLATKASTSGSFTDLAYTGTFTGGTGIVNLGSGQFYKDASGNVGIGATPSAWFSTFKSIEIGLGASISGRTADYRFYAGSNYYVDSGGNSIYKSTAPASRYIQSSAQHSFESAGTGTAGTAITFSQVLAVSKSTTLALEGATSVSGTGITFPATQSASSDANTLDDYEEGTWTPAQGAGLTVVGTFSSTGKYTKVGNQVTFWATLSATTSIAIPVANGKITDNLPFTASYNGVGGCLNGANTASILTNPSTISVYAAGTLAGSGALIISGTYMT